MTEALTLLDILAIVMFGEAGMLDDEAAAKAVGHVFINRMEHGGWGVSATDVMTGFHSQKTVTLIKVPGVYFQWAAEVVGSPYDPTGGAYFIFSWQDLNGMFSLYGPYMRDMADWKSDMIIGSDGLPYGLFAYKRWPELDCDDDGVREYTGFVIRLFDAALVGCRQLLQGEWK